MKRSEALFGILRIPLDALAVLAALALSYRLREANVDLLPWIQLLDPSSTLPSFGEYLRWFIVPSIAVFVVCAVFLGMYVLQTTYSAWSEVGRVLLASALWLTAVMVWFFLVRKQLFFSRILLLHGAFFLAIFTIVLRGSVTMVQRSLLRSGIGVRRVISFGVSAMAIPALKFLDRDVRYMYLGHVSSIAELEKLHRERHVDLVLQTDPNPNSGDTLELIDACRSSHIGYAFLPPVFADVPHQLHVERLGLLPMIRFQPTPLDGWGRIFKRLFDCAGALLLLIILSPLLLLVAILIVVTSGFPVLYISKRIGEHAQKNIPVLKFRTMVRNADAMKNQLEEHNHRKDGPLFKIKNDPRVTPIGRILRRLSIDEFPQLFNVLIGQMSLVGPRPHLPSEVERYTHYQRRVFAVKPGITGLAQISGRSDLKFEEEVALDLQYVEEWKSRLDLWILWRTLLILVDQRGAD